MDISQTVYTVFALVSGVILVLGVVLNGVVCVFFLAYRSLLSTEENILIFSMALSDFFGCVAAVPTSLISNLNREWVFGNAGCQIHALIVTLGGLVSITHFTALSVNRYKKLTERVHKNFNRKRAVYCVSAMWAYSFSFAVAPVVGWSRYTTEGIGTSCSVDWKASDANAVSYTTSLFFGCFFIPITLIFFSFSKIYKSLRSMTTRANNIWGKLSVFARQTAKAESKMTALIFVMVIAFLIAWVPYAMVSLICAFGGSRWISPLLASAPAYLAKSSLLYNPVLYFFMYRRFRIKVLKLLQSWILGTQKIRTLRKQGLATFLGKKTNNTSLRQSSFK